MQPAVISHTSNTNANSQAKLSNSHYAYNTPVYTSKSNGRNEANLLNTQSYKHSSNAHLKVVGNKNHNQNYGGINLQIQSPNDVASRPNISSGLQTTKNTTSALICSPKPQSSKQKMTPGQMESKKNLSYSNKCSSRNNYGELKTTSTNQNSKSYLSQMQYHQKYKADQDAYRAQQNGLAAAKTTSISNAKPKSVGVQQKATSKQMQQYSSNTQKLSGLVTSSSKAGTLDHSYFQQLLKQHNQISPKAGQTQEIHMQHIMTEASVSSPTPRGTSVRSGTGYGQVFSPAAKGPNNQGYAQIKAQQQKANYDHNANRDKIRQETIDKTIETIQQMKQQNPDQSKDYLYDKKASQSAINEKYLQDQNQYMHVQKDNFASAEVTHRAKSNTTTHNFKASSSKPQLINQPLISTRGANQTAQAMSKYPSGMHSSRRDKNKSSSNSRPQVNQDTAPSQIYSEYKHFIDKQRKIVNQLSQSKLNDRTHESILETITENRPGTSKNPVAATPRAFDNKKSALIETNQYSNTKFNGCNDVSRRKSSGLTTHRKDFISENKKLTSGIYQPTSASKAKIQTNIAVQRKSSSQVSTTHMKRETQQQQQVQKLNSTINPLSQSKISSRQTQRVHGLAQQSNDKSPKSSAFSFYNVNGNKQSSFGVTQYIHGSGNKMNKFSSKSNLNMTQNFSKTTVGSKIQTHRDAAPSASATPRNTNSQATKSNQKKNSYSNGGYKSFVSSRGNTTLLNKGQSSRSALQQYPTKSNIEHDEQAKQSDDFVKALQQQNIMLQNTAAELLTFAQVTKGSNQSVKQKQSGQSSPSKLPQDQGIDQLVLTQELLLGPAPAIKSEVANMLVNSKQKSPPTQQVNTPSSAGAPGVLLSSSQIKRDQEAFECSVPKPFAVETQRKSNKLPTPSKKKQDKENLTTPKVIKESSPKTADVLTLNKQQNVQQEAPKVEQPSTKDAAPTAISQAKTPPQNPMDDTMVFSEKSSLDDYIIGKQIGQGAYAVVRIGLHKPTNQKVAMKIYKKYKLEEPNRRKSVKREIKLMEKMKHQHIIQLYEIIDTTKYVILVMEYIGGGSLHGYLKSKSNRRLEENDAKRIFSEILEGLKYCHSRCITHRDIKLENLLLDDKNIMKIIDFGFSTCIPNDKKIKIFCGTPSYMAPEIVQKTEYCGPPADIWALGVLLFTCLSGQFPYRGATDEELYDKINRADYHLPSSVKDTLSKDAIDLLANLFKIKAEERPSARELLQHPWFKHITSQGSSDLADLSIQKRAKSQNQNVAGSNTHRATNYQTKQEIIPQKITNRDLQFNPFNGQMQSPAPEQGRQLQIDPQSQNLARSNSHVIGKQSQTQKHCSRKQLIFGGDQAQPEINHNIVKIIVDKLGYTSEEVMRYLLSQKEQNSFVSNLYQRLLDEEIKRGVSQSKIVSQQSLGENVMSASGYSLGFGQGNQTQNQGIKPSYVPSVKSLTSATGGGSYMNLSNNLKSNNFNNTQPLSNRYLNNTADSNSAVSPQDPRENLRLAQTFSSSTRSGYGGQNSFFNQTTQNTYRGSSTTPQGGHVPQHFNNFFSNTNTHIEQTQGQNTQCNINGNQGEQVVQNMTADESPDFNKQNTFQQEQGIKPQMFYGHEQDVAQTYRQNQMQYQMVTSNMGPPKSAVSHRMERV